MNLITPIDRKFLCQHRNGDTFATNPTTDYVPYSQGDVIEKLKFVGQYEVQTVTSAGIGVEIKAETVGSQIKLTHPFSNWDVEEGFVSGNSVYITANGNNTTGTVDSIAGTEMFLTAASFFSNLSTTDGDYREDYVIYSTTAPTTIRFMFGLIPINTFQAVQNSYASLINGEDQLYTGSGLSGSPTTLDYSANPATDLGSVDVTYDGASGTGSSVFTFTIEHIYRIPHFIEDWLTNYINGTIPPNFQGNGTYSYVNYMNFGNNINNPNEGKIFEDSFQNGSTGFVGQNFNVSSTDYSLDSSVIDISGTVVTIPEVTETNSFTVTIDRASANFTAGVKVYAYVSKLPSTADATDQANTYDTNFVLDQHDVLEGAGASSSSIILNLDANIDGGDPKALDITFDLAWSAEQQGRFDTNDNLFVGIVLEDGALTAPLSDRTLVKVYAGVVSKNPDISGLITQNQIDIFSTATDPTLITPTSDIDTWDNRAYYLDGYFRLTKYADSDDALLSSFKVSTIARKPGTDTFFVIDEYIFPTGTDSKVPGTIVNVDGTGYQSFAVVSTRPVGNVPEDDDLRKVELISTIPGSFQNYQEFNWWLGIEIPHRDWILNPDVDTVFYNGSLPDEFYNLNRKTSNYSNSNGYEIFIVATATVIKDGISTTYHMGSDQSAVADFDVDVIGTGWSAETKYYDLFDNEIDVPYEGENCRVEVTITHPVSAAADAAGEIVFEYTGETGQTHRLSSEVDWSGALNALEGLSGSETLVTATQPNTTTTVLECIIKGEFLFDGVDINTYGHLMKSK